MIKLKIKADAEQAVKAMKTNKPYRIGDIIPMQDEVAQGLLAEYPEYFENIDEPQALEEKIDKSKDEFFKDGKAKNIKPEHNKMLGKGSKFKTA